MILGYDDNHRVTFGIIENSTYEMIVNNNVAWASALKLFTNETMVTGQWKTQTITVEEGKVTFKNQNTSQTSQINLDKLWRCVVNNGAKIRNIKIKPL